MMKTLAHSLKTALPAGVFAAAAAALLWLTVLSLPFLPVLFGIGAALPIYFTIFAGDWRSGFIAACVAALLLCLALPVAAGLLLALYFFIPALLTGWLLGLKTPAPANGGKKAGAAHAAEKPRKTAAKPSAARAAQMQTAQGQAAHTAALAQSDQMRAYPLSAALFQLALAVAGVTIAAVFYSFSLPNIGAVFAALIKQIISFMQQQSFYENAAPDGDVSALLQRLLPAVFAVSLALYGFLFQLGALYGAMLLAARRKALKRPFGCWPADLRLPPAALVMFIALWVLSYFLGGARFETAAGAAPTLALCVTIILAALATAFCVCGLAALHMAARGPWAALRYIVYICLFSVVLTPVIFFGLVIMGLFATPFSSVKTAEKPPLP